MYTNPCGVAANIQNTGSECTNPMLATGMLVMMPKDDKWEDADMEDFTGYINTKIHAAAGSRWYPIFGNAAPVRQINDGNESDVLETLEDGSVQFIRYGMYNRTFLTTDGGLALAKALMGMKRDYAFIEVDITGKVAKMKNSDGTYSGFPVNLAYAPAPILANLKSSYKNQFMISFSPNNYIKKGVIFTPDTDEDVLSLRGLYDTKVTAGSGTHSTTNIFVDVATIVGGSDLVARYGATLAVVSNFVVKAANGSTITPSAAAVIGGEVRLTGVYTAATNITVSLAAPSVLKTAGIEGYEGTVSATVPIP